MIRRQACVLILAVAALAGCEKKVVGPGDGAGQLPSRAKAVGEFPDNPLLASAPADAPYAFATFLPLPTAAITKWVNLVKPIWKKAFSQVAPSDDSQEAIISRDILAAVDTLDLTKIEQYGFSLKARLVFYGDGAYPVMRGELADGKKVFDLVNLLAARWKATLPAPSERAGGHYWLIDGSGDFGVLVAIMPKELIAAAAPRAQLEAHLATLLGEQKPAQSLTTASFKAIAERDGYTGHGVGFVDVVKVGAMVAQHLTAPDCAPAIAKLAGQLPRVTIGYDDFAVNHFAFGMVLELAPAALAELRGVTGKLAGLDRLLAGKPAAAFAVAADLEHGRTALGRVATVISDLGTRCQAPPLMETGGKLSEAAGRPLPPFLAGLHGGYAVLTDIVLDQRMQPTKLDGFASIQLDHAGNVLQLAKAKMPQLEIPADGKAHPLPAGVMPLPGFAAASEKAIGIGIGTGGEAKAVEVLGGTPAPAPLAVMAFDYGRMGDLLPVAQGEDGEQMRAIFKMLGRVVMQVVVDERGLVFWSSLDQ